MLRALDKAGIDYVDYIATQRITSGSVLGRRLTPLYIVTKVESNKIAINSKILK